MCYSAKIQTFSPTKHTLSFHRLAALFVYQHRVHARDFSKEKKKHTPEISSFACRRAVPCQRKLQQPSAGGTVQFCILGESIRR